VNSPVRHINPYRETAIEYHKAGWHGPIILPYKQKNPPPTGYTGHAAPYPNAAKIKEWRTDGTRHNIGLRLAGVDKEHEIIGIDVDHYQSGDKQKKGGDQLKELESQFGPLPPTWISSSRTDGISGIRYFKVPRGMAFRGQVAKDIECINKGYRFAAVWPSVHPSGNTYWWFPPNTVPNEEGRGNWVEDGLRLPRATELPILPDKWLEYLTQNMMRADADDRIDMDSGVDEIYQWADATFHGDEDTPMCKLYRDKIGKHKKLVVEEATLHDKIVNGHYNLIRLAAEGHVGWNIAINEFEQICLDKVESGQKDRGRNEIIGEIWRSRVNGLRKVKAQCDDQLKIGAKAVLSRCDEPGGVCYRGSSASDGQGDSEGTNTDGTGDDPPPDDPLGDIPRGMDLPCDEYLLNDDGNAAHLVDYYSSLKTGPAFRHAEGYGWLVWHLGKGDDQPHWQLDSEGNQEMRRMFQRIRDKQLDYAETALKPAWIALQDQYDKQTPGVSKADVELAKVKYREWKSFAQQNGNNRNANNAIEAAKSIQGVSISVNSLDKNPLLLGVANGVLELGQDSVQLRSAQTDDLITLNTGVVYEPPSALAQSTWDKYLNTFLPDPDLRRTVQIALGHCLIGGNPEKRIIILKGQSETGKSTMLSAIQSALGDYAAPVNEGMFQLGHFNEVLANALDKRVVVCSEFDSSMRLSASLIKRLTGNDTISVPIKYSNESREGEAQFVTILATNVTPDIVGADKALENRLFVIPFETRPQHIDRSLSNIVVHTCKTAVLWWLVDGYKQYRVHGQLPMSKVISDKTQEFMVDTDHVIQFLQECFTKHDSFSKNIDWKIYSEWCIKKEKLHNYYDSWCIANKISDRERLSPHMLTKRLRSLGVPDHGNTSVSVNGAVGRYWFGLKARKTRAMGNVYRINTQQEPTATTTEDTKE
jgi:P4 family phage/plasmid primase-like protien